MKISPPHQVEIAMQKDVISMNRKGSIEADMVFQKGKRFESRYRTPYGAMDMAVFCTKAGVYRRTATGARSRCNTSSISATSMRRCTI